MYKLTRPDGFDFYSGTINYRENIGKIIRVTDFDLPSFGSCGKGLHASRNPNDCFIGAEIPCAAFLVKGIQRIAGDKKKSRYQAVKVLKEIKDLDSLFGWKYSEAKNPIHPFKIPAPKITNYHIELLEKWDSVWTSVRGAVRVSVWDSVRGTVGDFVWNSVRDFVWNSVRGSVGDSVRGAVRDSVWDSVGGSVWAYVGSLFPNIRCWKYLKHKRGEYPFQPAVDLWRVGLVPSYDGNIWRLHGGKKSSNSIREKIIIRNTGRVFASI